MATSGGYERFVEIEGRRYSHLIDPRTGWPVEGLLSVSAVAQAAVVAGSIASAALLRPQADALDWLETCGAPYLAVDTKPRVPRSFRARLVRLDTDEIGRYDQRQIRLARRAPHEVQAVDDQPPGMRRQRVHHAVLRSRPVEGVEPGLHAQDIGQAGHAPARAGTDAEVAQTEVGEQPCERGLKLRLRDTLGFRLPEFGPDIAVGFALGREQFRPVPPAEGTPPPCREDRRRRAWSPRASPSRSDCTSTP